MEADEEKTSQSTPSIELLNNNSSRRSSRHENVDVIERCHEWLSNCNLSDCGDSLSAECSDVSSITTSSSAATESNLIFRHGHGDINRLTENIAGFSTTPRNLENVTVYKSKKVHIGDVIYIHQDSPTINHQMVNSVTNNFESKPIENFPTMITRRNWLAQPPMEPPTFLPEPAKFVIILHSATEEGFTQADNTLIVRLIQTFHIESKKWSDIAYNFLVGADGSVFEGRGWNVKGAHSHHYNRLSIGICFIGCYTNHLPPPAALRKAKALLRYGVEMVGAIDKDYKLLAHRQCSSTESPGQRLYEEIKTWDHWDGSIDLNNPSPLIL